MVAGRYRNPRDGRSHLGDLLRILLLVHLRLTTFWLKVYPFPSDRLFLLV